MSQMYLGNLTVTLEKSVFHFVGKKKKRGRESYCHIADKFRRYSFWRRTIR